MKKSNNIDAKKIEELVQSGEAILLDVRREDEWAEGHAKIATRMQSNRILEDGEVPTQDKKVKIFTYCHGGGRAGRVADALIEKQRI